MKFKSRTIKISDLEWKISQATSDYVLTITNGVDNNKIKSHKPTYYVGPSNHSVDKNVCSYNLVTQKKQ